jgi:hypothetical protein
MTRNNIDTIIEKLARDVESSVHALYRGEVRQETAKAHTVQLVLDARLALTDAIAANETHAFPRLTPSKPEPFRPRHSGGAPRHSGASYGWTTADSDAVLKCILSWLPVGAPSSTSPDSKCIAAGRMLVPTWAERELAAEAVKRIAED